MPYIDNDMDDLYSKAGRHYPLKTDSANWEAVAAQLAEGNTPPSAAPRKGFQYGWLGLLLIPIVFFTIKKTELLTARHSADNTAGSTNNAGYKNGAGGNKISDKQMDIVENTKGGNPVSDVKTKKLQGSTQPDLNSSRSTTLSATDTLQGNDSIDHAAGFKIRKLPGRIKMGEINRVRQESSLSDKPISDDRSRNDMVRGTKKGTRSFNTTHVSDLDEPAGTEKASDEEQNGHKQINSASESANAGEADLFGRLLKFGTAWDGSPGNRTDLFNSDSMLAKAYQKLPARSASDQGNYFYYGVTVAPDLSSIKWQSVKNVGYNLGVFVGYHFANRLSVEGSFLWDRKKYYSSGKYFDKTKAGIPDYIWVHWVNGGCNMFEIPLALRYDFSSMPSTFFASVGVNSYIMKKENYAYDATAPNGVWYLGHRAYNNSGNHFLASMLVSAGYSAKIARNTNIRFEPFYKVPLKKIGSGNMPLTSTGINLSLVRRIP
jgi:Outer membrane protein beta-barrel domain